MAQKQRVFGPSFREMLDPRTIDPKIRQRAIEAQKTNILDPINLFNISWKGPDDKVRCVVIPRELTNVEPTIVVMYSKDFPTGSHKVGATYSVLMEAQLQGSVTPGEHTLVWPSTGNYGIGGAWVGPRMGYDSLVILPEEMSRERFEKISYYGARYIKTPGCESNVKEIFDKCNELKRDNHNRILNQFEVMANYRFHYHVTGNSIIEAVKSLAGQSVGNGRVAAYVSSMGSAGTISAGDRLKQQFYECRIVGLEPIQCPTLYWNGFGGHDIQGIGDKHVTWIHNVMNMDAMMCLDDMECKLGLQLLTDPVGKNYLEHQAGIPAATVEMLSGIFGISGVCNLLGAIKTARFFGFDRNQVIVTVATDAIDRYHSVMGQLDRRFGTMNQTKAAVRLDRIFHNAKLDWISEGTVHNRHCWHNLKYYTWVEQQGKTVAELNALAHQDFWLAEQAKIDGLIRQQEAVRAAEWSPEPRG